MKIGIGIEDIATKSTEAKRLSLIDEKEFWDGYNEKTTKYNIKVTNVLTFDEFDGFFVGLRKEYNVLGLSANVQQVVVLQNQRIPGLR